MLRTLFVGVFLSIYILLVGPPLLVYTFVTRNPDPLYWAGINGVMFFVRAVGVRVRVGPGAVGGVVAGREIPPGVFSLSAPPTPPPGAPGAVPGPSPGPVPCFL